MRNLTAIRLVTGLYLGFVIYGSLVPLDYVAVPLDEAIGRFRAIPYLELGMDSRADWVANLLLFVPLAFLAMTSVTVRQRPARLLIAALIVLAGVGLSVGIEFVQIFFPPRTVSQNDVFAEGLGSLLGVALGWRYGPRFERYIGNWRRTRGRSNLAEQLLWAYALVLIGYSVLPLDLTISPVEIYHKWTEGRLNLVPFAAFGGGAVDTVYQLAVDVVLWIPIALLLSLSQRATPRQAFYWTVVVALAVELAQLLVYSRVTDVTDVLTAVPGAWAGSVLGRRLLGADPQAAATPVITGTRLWLALGLMLGWTLVLFAVFWYPFEFELSPTLIKERLGLLVQVPFLAYYQGSEYRAITEVAHKVGFFLPLGALAGVLRMQLDHDQRLIWPDALLLAATFSVALAIELGQVAMPLKSPDSTDVLLMWVGAAIGLAAVRWSKRRWNQPEGSPRDEVALAAPAAVPSQRRSAATGTSRLSPVYLIGQPTLIAAVYLFATSDFAPYNVKELLQPVPMVSVVVLVVGATLYFAPLAVAGHRLMRSRPDVLATLVFLLAHGLLSYFLLRAVVPIESLDDILGYPVTELPRELERLGRFVALELPVAVVFMGGAAAWQAIRSSRPQYYLRWILLLLPAVAFGHWIVVAAAATDNLVELLRDGGGVFSTYFLVLWAWLIAVTAYLTSAAMARQLRLGLAILAIAIAVPIGYLLLSMALAPELYKYGQRFSALQFLLSPSRARYISPDLVPGLYALAHVAFTAAVAFAQYPRWVWPLPERPTAAQRPRVRGAFRRIS